MVIIVGGVVVREGPDDTAAAAVTLEGRGRRKRRTDAQLQQPHLLKGDRMLEVGYLDEGDNTCAGAVRLARSAVNQPRPGHGGPA